MNPVEIDPAYMSLFGIIWSTIVAATGWHMGYRSGLAQQRKLKRERFSSYVETLQQEVRSGRIGARLAHRATFDDFRKEAREVRPHIGDKAEFDAACDAYRSVEFSDRHDEKSAAGKAKVLAILDELLGYAK
jgi:hypothetical protein